MSRMQGKDEGEVSVGTYERADGRVQHNKIVDACSRFVWLLVSVEGRGG